VSILRGDERERAVEVRFTFEAVSAGRYVLPEIPVSVAGQPYLTEARLIEIGRSRNRDQVPFLVRWAGPQRPLYAGEARVYALEIYNVTEYIYPSSISMRSPQNAIFEEVQGLGSIEQYVVDGVTLYAIPVAVFMVTASEASDVELPAAEVATESLSATAEPRTITVRPLPEPVEATGAVGRFSYDVELEPSAVLPTETVTLRLRVSGSGNLHFLVPPEPDVVGFQVEREELGSSLTPTQSGYEGYRERRLTLRPQQSERYAIEPGEFVYFDPTRSEVVTDRPAAPEPTILDLSSPLSAAGEQSPVTLLTVDEIASLERRTWYDDPLAYGWLIPGLLFLVARRIWKRRDVSAVVLIVCGSLLLVHAASDRLPWDDIERGIRQYEARDLSDAVYSFERASRAVPSSPGVNYNLAVLYFKLGDIPRSVFAARESIRVAPVFGRARELLETVELSAGIDRSVPPPHLVHPDHMFVALAILVNAFFVGMALTRRRGRRGWVVIAGILVVLLAAGATTGLVTAAMRHNEQLGVVRGDVTLRRIPGSGADGWLPVRAGSAVRVVAGRDNYLLVRTVLGLEGWVEVRDLLWTGSPVSQLLRYRGYAL
jgi:hypothetical protein